MTWSARKIASAMLCVTNSVVARTSATIRSSSRFSRSRVNSSSAPNGSSRSRMSAPVCSSRASATRCCMPPDNCRGNENSNPFRPTSLRRSIARLLSSRVTRPPSSLGKSTFSTAVRQSSNVAFWNIMPTSLRGAATSWPCTVRCPELRGIRPATRRKRVDLPHPLGPTIEVNAPFSTVKLASSSATTEAEKILPSPSASITIGDWGRFAAGSAGRAAAAAPSMRRLPTASFLARKFVEKGGIIKPFVGAPMTPDATRACRAFACRKANAHRQTAAERPSPGSVVVASIQSPQPLQLGVVRRAGVHPVVHARREPHVVVGQIARQAAQVVVDLE
jgi:hypothetical protein